MMQARVAPLMALVSAVAGALGGSSLIHKLTKSRYLLAAHRAIRTDYRISAYLQLVNVSIRLSGMLKGQVGSLEYALGM